MNSIFLNPLKDAIFVFGSNLKGIHDKGGASLAAKYYGAQSGQGEGFAGQSYALPIKDNSLDTLSLSEVNMHVKNFLAYAKERRDAFFMVTRIGCGMGGFSDDQIAPMFNKVPNNVWLPGKWLLKLNHLDRARLIVDGTPEYADISHIEHTLIEDTKFWNRKFELITSNEPGPGAIAAKWCRRDDLPWTPIPADTNKFGIDAEKIRNFQMTWYATHLIAYWDEVSPNTKHLVEHAQNEGLRVKVNKIMSHEAQLELVG